MVDQHAGTSVASARPARRVFVSIAQNLSFAKHRNQRCIRQVVRTSMFCVVFGKLIIFELIFIIYVFKCLFVILYLTLLIVFFFFFVGTLLL